MKKKENSMDFFRKISYLYDHKESENSTACGFVKVQRQGSQIRLKLSLTKRIPALRTEEEVDLVYEKTTPKGQMLYAEKIGMLNLLGNRPSFSCMIQEHTKLRMVGVTVAGHIRASLLPEQERVCWEKIGKEEQETDLMAAGVNLSEEEPSEDNNIETLFEEDERECIETETVKYWRIDRRDFGKMPKWVYDAFDNSFAAHGYMVYKHLIVGCAKEPSGEAGFVGVPGVFYQQEKLLARMYGYPGFLLDRQDGEKANDFGYWIRWNVGSL
jgi:hypothetical protein